MPCAHAVLPHLIPLIALESMLAAGRHETAFLVPHAFHKTLESNHKNVLDIDFQIEHSFRNEMLACGHFCPDVVVDDFSFTALLTTKLSNRPRVTIRRTGVFPGSATPNNTYRHSMHSKIGPEFDFGTFYRDSEAFCGVPAPKNLADICAADMNIVPGIRSVEVLPAALCDDPTYVFAGALIVPDFVVSSGPIDDLRAFFENNQRRPVVFLTLGSVLEPSQSIRDMIGHMLDRGVAVISNVILFDVRPFRNEMFFHAPFLPMHTVCSKVDLMVHHCGSGTYQYAIKHKLPSICLGSQCYDRDDVARRLEELGVAKYIPVDEASEVAETFRELFDDCVNTTSHWYRTSKRSLDLLKDESDRTAAAFNFEAVLEKAVSIHA